MSSATLDQASGTVALLDPDDIPVLVREFREAAHAFDSLLRKLEAGLCPISSLRVAECSGCVAGHPNHSSQGVRARLLSIQEQYPHVFDFLTRVLQSSVKR